MKIKSSTIILSTTCLLLSGCGGDNTQGNDNSSTKPAPGSSSDFKQQLLADNTATVLAFNGFSGNGTFYDANPMNLAGDLSATHPANLYLYDTFINAIEPKPSPTTVVAASYRRSLPASSQTIETGNTLLNPGLAMNSSDPTIAAQRGKITVSNTNPVLLSIPAGLSQRPEAPFFPAGTKYTALIVESPTLPTASHGPIISIEAGAAPVQFAAFAHQQGKTFTLRTYDSTSTVDKSGTRLLLTAAKNPARIQSRFVVLAADDFQTIL